MASSGAVARGPAWLHIVVFLTAGLEKAGLRQGQDMDAGTGSGWPFPALIDRKVWHCPGK